LVVPTNKSALAGPTRPLGSPDIPQFFLPRAPGDGVYAPHLYGAARIHFVDKKRKLDETRQVAYMVPLEVSSRTVDWESALPVTAALEPAEPLAGSYLPLPAGAMDIKVFARWAKGFDRWLARTQRLDVIARPEAPEVTTIGPKRGGVSVDLVAIVWVLT
jgi:hypothetical protein